LKTTALILGIAFFFLTLSSTVCGQDVEISIPNSSGARGGIVTIPVNISDTTGRGIIAVEITLQYDPQVLSAIDADTSGTIAETWQIAPNTAVPGEVSVSMIGPLGINEVTPLSGSGTFVNIRFSVQRGAQIGSTSELHFTKVLLNEGTPGAVAYDGVFTVERLPVGERLEGDVNGDDHVDRRDLLKLVVLYNKHSGDSEYDASADFNADGLIDKLDMMILWQNFGATRG